MTEVTVRLYAAAAEAAGTHELGIETAENQLPLPQLISRLTDHSSSGAEAAAARTGTPSLQRICAQSSFLINGTRADPDSAVVSPGDTVDVLPPFAGG